jgi:hypothetical protein
MERFKLVGLLSPFLFDPEAAGEPAGQRHHDGAAHDIGGQRPGDGWCPVGRTGSSLLDVRLMLAGIWRRRRRT